MALTIDLRIYLRTIELADTTPLIPFFYSFSHPTSPTDMNPATAPMSYRDDPMAPAPIPYFDDPEKGRETPVSPPAYGTVEEQPSPPTDDRVERKKACKRRFWKFVGYSVLVWGLVHLVVHKKHQFKHGFHQRPVSRLPLFALSRAGC